MIIGSFDASAFGFPSPTVIRTRGEVCIKPSTSITSDLEIVGAYGIAVITDAAFAAGTISISAPFDDAGWGGWLVWRSFHYSQENVDSTGVYTNQHTQEVDSKAMRKMTDDETMVLMAQSQVGAFRISMALRHLFKLS